MGTYSYRTRGPFIEAPGNYRACEAVLFSIPEGSFKSFECYTEKLSGQNTRYFFFQKCSNFVPRIARKNIFLANQQVGSKLSAAGDEWKKSQREKEQGRSKARKGACKIIFNPPL